MADFWQALKPDTSTSSFDTYAAGKLVKLFCKPACRHQHNNRKRLSLVESQIITVGQAASSMGKSYEQVRAMIRRGEIRAQRLFKRILVYRADVEIRR